MSAARTGARLLRAYPRGWRERYGAELETLIVEASEGGRVSLATRFDVARSGFGERLRAAGLRPEGPPAHRVRAAVLRVLCGWALFVLGGLLVAKFSEHWQGAVPAGEGSVAKLAFAAILAAAASGTALVLAGVATSVPAFLRLLRNGGWTGVRKPLLAAAALALAVVAATAGLALWAGTLSPHGRNGGDASYAAAFLAWALLLAVALVAWTGAAVAIARRLELPLRVVRAQAWLAVAATAAMSVLAAATLLWWVEAAAAGPRFFAGSSLAPQLLAAVALMALGLALAVPSAWRAAREAPRIGGS